MFVFGHLIILLSITKLSTTIDVCTTGICTCDKDQKNVNCDNKQLNTLTDIDFPFNVNILSLIKNKLQFHTGKC